MPEISIEARAKQVLKSIWGYDEFRSPQLDIIQSIVSQQDTIALLPTGGGKSLCYQVPGLIIPGKVVVVSPLISLMLDQVKALNERGVTAKALHSGLMRNEIDLILDNFVHGPLKFLYISPERIATEEFQVRYFMANVGMIAIDEAHCISQWGHDFRPSYLKISILRELKPHVPLIALTATATPKIVGDISDQLYLKNPNILSKSFARDNISFTVIKTDDKLGELLKILNLIKGSTIIYLRSRNGCAKIAGVLEDNGYTSTIYHAGLSFEQREAHQKKWMQNKVRIIVATNAFGMGIDKKDVRLVIHLDVVSSVEDYYQEAGRAGRDGDQSHAIAILNRDDLYSAAKVNETSYPELSEIEHIYAAMCRKLKIAVGAGVGKSYYLDFDLFCIEHKINIMKFRSVLRLLEKQGWLEVNEGFSLPDKATALCRPSDARDFYKEEDPRGIVLTELLRSYPGLWDVDAIEINATQLALKVEMEKNTVVHLLKVLQREGMIWYQEWEKVPEIIFHYPRPKREDFKIDEVKYIEQKKESLRRLHYMVQYFTGSVCRQKVLLEYFGEQASNCEKCDICRGSNETQYTVAEKKKVIASIYEFAQSPSVKEVIMQWPYNKRKRIEQCISDLKEEGYLEVSDKGIILRKNQ